MWSGLIPDYYSNKTVDFKFRGFDFRFNLSLGLFSSAGIDAGSILLLKAFSRFLDRLSGNPFPRFVLDCGCGAGILGVCAAKALESLRSPQDLPVFVRTQDRDELARVFTEYNARQNGIGPGLLRAYTEPLLAEQEDPRLPPAPWDLILTNIPAKAGGPVLEDFAARSLRLLSNKGRVFMVTVAPLAGFFRSLILKSGGELLGEEAGGGHTVFVYGRGQGADGPEHDPGHSGPVRTGAFFPDKNPFYLRASGDYELEGRQLRIKTIHGCPGFDDPGPGVRAAAKLFKRLGTNVQIPPDTPVLIHEGGQGFFPAWLAQCIKESSACNGADAVLPAMTLSGRNILTLEAARYNTGENARARIIPSVELPPPETAYGFIAAFPELVSGADRIEAYWENLKNLLCPGGTALVTLPSGGAEKFDRKKRNGFTRLGDIKRQGFRALAYRRPV
jgi:hypothetical protein